ncbi:MAG: hypothetical protein AAB414_01805 [Patescibacteria group bacterium]
MGELAPIEITDINVVHRPFRDVTNLTFPRELIDNPYYYDIHKSGESVASARLTFEGRPIGRFCTVPVTPEFARETRHHTPMGRVRILTEESYEEGEPEESPKNPFQVIHEAPLVMAITVSPKSIKVYEALNEYIAAIHIEGIVYQLPVVDPWEEDYVKKHLRENRTALISNNWDTINSNREPSFFVIPGVPQSVQRVGLEFQHNS